MSLEDYITLKPLVEGLYRPEPPNCKRNFGDRRCIKKVQGGTCPTNCLETGVCGGWKPRDGLLPLRSLIEKIKG